MRHPEENKNKSHQVTNSIKYITIVKFKYNYTRQFVPEYVDCCRYKWPRGLRRGSAAARLLGLRVRISPGAWVSVSFDCCFLLGRGLCVGLITLPEESYRV
jgi:hypothetical protein